MTNKGAVLIADSLLGLDFRVIVLGGKAYRVSPPTIRTLCRAIREFGPVDLPEGLTLAEALPALPGIAERLVAGVACFFDERDAEAKLADCTPAELLGIMQQIATLICPDDFFACAALARNVAEMAAKPRS